MDRRRILIVEGNAELRTVLADALAGLGHEVVTAGDRAEALDREDLEEFDLIISDLAEYSDSAVQIVSELKRKRRRGSRWSESADRLARAHKVHRAETASSRNHPRPR